MTGSELVGLIPLEALLQVGRHYLRKQGSCLGVAEKELVRTAVQSLGLAEISAFNPEHKIIEYRFRKTGPLAAMTLVDFCAELASDSPAPGGGSIAALSGSLSAGLSAMVGNLTFGKKGYEAVAAEMEIVAEKAQPLKDFFIDAIDKDTEAFNRLMAAFSLPKKTDEEKQTRLDAIDEATQGATMVPFSVLEKSRLAAELALIVAEKGNRNSLSDAGVAGLTAAVCAEGALYNVLINTQEMADGPFRSKTRTQARMLCAAVLETVAKIKAVMDKGFAG